MTMVRTLEVAGLRAFSTNQSVEFALPLNTIGSGITVVVGSNNSGKSTLIESLRFLIQRQPPSLSEGKRNIENDGVVELKLTLDDGTVSGLKTIRPGGSETAWIGPAGGGYGKGIFVLPSRRTFSPYFGSGGYSAERDLYSGGYGLSSFKESVNDRFASRLFKIDRDEDSRREFNNVLARVVSPVPQWTIDQSEAGQYYLRFTWGGDGRKHAHSSDGLGEGLVSLLFIVDSLYDSHPGSMVVIDEPELSLHPQFQRRLQRVLADYARDRQIVYATHSPYFVSWSDIANGARVVRVRKGAEGSAVFEPESHILDKVARLGRDLNNPHVLGLDANEVFFLDDGVVLTEGQEDVIFLRRVIEQLDLNLKADFFGWGVGGAEKMEAVTELLRALGYRLVVGILDNDKESARESLQSKFSGYLFRCIDADDVRPKSARTIAAKHGLVDHAGKVRPEHLDPTKQLFADVQEYLDRDGNLRPIL